jgi:hypothetical protein
MKLFSFTIIVLLISLISFSAFAQDEPSNEPQYLILAPASVNVQMEIANRKMGYEIDIAGEYVKPWVTKNSFQVIFHPTAKNKAAIVITKLAGMKDAEEWCRGRSADVTETADRLFPSNKPLVDYATMKANGWFDENK